jgi:hypothetical protein
MYAVVFFMFNSLRFEVIFVWFVDNDGIVDHYYLNVLFIISFSVNLTTACVFFFFGGVGG